MRIRLASTDEKPLNVAASNRAIRRGPPRLSSGHCSHGRHRDIWCWGHAGFDNVENQLRSLLQEADLWKATSLDADYPAA